MRDELSDHGDLGNLILRHLDAAYNLARWLTRDATDAEDVVQEAILRALKYGSGFAGEDIRPWLLKIVRNTGYAWLSKNRGWSEFDELEHGGSYDDTETIQIAKLDAERLKTLLFELPTEYREVLILRELEGLSYREIADVTDIPVGTVMSRIARARQRLRSDAARHVKVHEHEL
ncbi:MAG TPA: sigma-70 family RNA polymerase sigma factor [Pyrinomonadaceae bacterium]